MAANAVNVPAGIATLTRRLARGERAEFRYRLLLTAEERTRSRLRFRTVEGVPVQLMLPRGTVLRDGDLLASEDGAVCVRVRARPEPVLTARANDRLTLLRAAYHLGNRHVPVEIGEDYLRLGPDPVLAQMLEQLGLVVVEEVAPFQPESGAYGGNAHSHERPAHGGDHPHP
ncbi:MAG TPA: urease accessory protein UreE [Burkholderiales bacterium]